MPANSLVLDDLLPATPVELKGTWKPSEEAVQALLGLDALSSTDVESTLGEVSNQGLATITMAGKVRGAVGGVASDIELKAKMEAQEGRIVRMALLIKEKRAIGHVNPGLDVVAKVLIKVAPIATSAHVSPAVVAKLPSRASASLTQLVYQPKDASYELWHDRRWFNTSDERALSVMRYLDRGELVAQCNISPVADAPQGKNILAMSLDEYQNEVKEALGKKFGQIVNSSESEIDQNHIYRVVAEGEQSELPIRWVYYLIVGPKGQRVSLSFTMEASLAERFGGADQELVAQIKLSERPTAKRETEKQPAEKQATAQPQPEPHVAAERKAAAAPRIPAR